MLLKQIIISEKQLKDETIRFSDLASCEKDTIRISLYDELNQQKKYISYITVSDILTSQTNTKQIWLNLTLDGLKNQSTRILLKANIFKSPTIQSQPHGNFDDFIDRFIDNNYEMIDPIYLIPLKNLSLIRQSMIYFLDKLNEEGLGSTSSIRLLQFLVDIVPADQTAAVEPPQDMTDRLVYRDFRKIFYEATSLHLTSSYANNVLLSEDHQTELLEKIGEPEFRKIHKIIKEIQKFKHKIKYEDLKKLFIYGVPSRYRCLYWSNFLQINAAVREDILNYPDGHESSPDDLVNRFEFYKMKDNLPCVKSFIDQLEIDVMGRQHGEMLAKILQAFTNYLKFHRIVDLTYEDRLRYNLYKFIQRVFVSLYPTFMKTEDNLHSSFFNNEKNEKTENNQPSKIMMSMKKIDQNDFTEDELKEKENKIRAEIFWFSVAFYNLYFKHLVAMEDEKGMEMMKKRIATGIVAYETLLNPLSKLMIEQNQLQDIIREQWFIQSASFFYSSFQSYNFTKVLDIVVFEFGMNLMDGFDAAIVACFVTLLDRIKLDAIVDSSQLENAFITEGLFLKQNFFVDLYKNIAKISQGFDPLLIEKKIQTLEFNQFGELYLPKELNEKNLEFDKKALETLEASNMNRTIDLVPANGEQNNNTLSPQKKSKAVNVKSPYVNRKEFLLEDIDYAEREINPNKNYLVSHRVKIDYEAEQSQKVLHQQNQQFQQQQQQQLLLQQQQQQQSQQKQQSQDPKLEDKELVKQDPNQKQSSLTQLPNQKQSSLTHLSNQQKDREEPPRVQEEPPRVQEEQPRTIEQSNNQQVKISQPK